MVGSGLTRRQTHLIFVGMLVTTFLASLDSTAVSTALPTIAGDLGGIDQLPWVLTAYLLGSVTATPLYGRLSDLYGRRALTQAALAIFVVTSVMAAASQNMWQLIVSRGLQGVGGGGLMAMGFIVIGDGGRAGGGSRQSRRVRGCSAGDGGVRGRRVVPARTRAAYHHRPAAQQPTPTDSAASDPVTTDSAEPERQPSADNIAS